MNGTPIQGQVPDPLRPASEVTPKSKTTGQNTPVEGSSSPTFQALLERLHERANELEKTSQTLDTPELLAGAVDSARASLEDAQSLSDRLLEAYRASRQRHVSSDPVGKHEEGSQ